MYRRLEIGEKIEVGDEVFLWNEENQRDEWIVLKENDILINDHVRSMNSDLHVPIRRFIKDKKRIDLYIEFPGDPSVGILSCFWEILNVGEEIQDKEHREEVRTSFKKAFEILIGDIVRVHFTDEIDYETE